MGNFDDLPDLSTIQQREAARTVSFPSGGPDNTSYSRQRILADLLGVGDETARTQS
jgi:hypothetical protein